jgi:hypothetical protein
MYTYGDRGSAPALVDADSVKILNGDRSLRCTAAGGCHGTVQFGTRGIDHLLSFVLLAWIIFCEDRIILARRRRPKAMTRMDTSTSAMDSPQRLFSFL